MIQGRKKLGRLVVGAALLIVLASVGALAAPAAAQSTATKPTPIDLNTADLKTIATLPGIGEALAQKIIDGRPYSALADLANVKGIGQSKIDALKGLVTFSKVKVAANTAVKAEAQTAAKVKTTAAVTTKTTAVDKTAAATGAAPQEEKALVNVNKADLQTLQTLPGIGEALAKRIIDGRPYKTRDEFGKVKGIGEAKLKDLKDLIVFEDKVVDTTVATKGTAAAVKTKTTAVDTTKTTATTKAVDTTKTAATTKAVDTATTAASTPGHVDLNTADLTALEGLPGIGPVLAQKIIDARPFKSVDDLTRVSGIGQSKLDAIKGLVTVGTIGTAASKLAPGQKIDINTATAEQLDALSGIGPVKAQAIIDYRTANGKFKAIEDIMKVKGIKEGEFAKIKDYIVIK